MGAHPGMGTGWRNIPIALKMPLGRGFKSNRLFETVMRVRPDGKLTRCSARPVSCYSCSPPFLAYSAPEVSEWLPLPARPATHRLKSRTLIDAHIKGFNTQDNDLFLSVFGDTAIIIDGIAPYRWLNPNAPANWLADVEKWRKNLGVTYEHLSYEMGFWNVEGSSAYAVISGTLTVTIKGQVRRSDRYPCVHVREPRWRLED